jgi:hypothetical protein
MFDSWTAEVLWVNVMNAILGLVCLVALVAVVGVTAKELFERARARAHATQFDTHTFVVPELGTTMADGGEPVEKTDTDDEPKS